VIGDGGGSDPTTPSSSLGSTLIAGAGDPLPTTGLSG
jgi:hypothetical protein